jgi:hypothetical protein
MLRDINPFGLRMPPDLREQVKNAAAKSGDSMNGEIVARLEASFSGRVDLSRVSTGELVRELIDRNEPGRILIEVSSPPEDRAKR